MASFHNQIKSKDVGYNKGRLVRELTESLIWFHEEKRIEMPVGMQSDGASVPRIPLLYVYWGDRVHREAFNHDYTYRKDAVLLIVDPKDNLKYKELIPERLIKGRFPILKVDADWYFRLTIKGHENPEYSWFVYHPMWLAVRLAGGSSFHRMNVADNFDCGCSV